MNRFLIPFTPKTKGFTIIEMLVVMAILSIVLVLTLVAINPRAQINKVNQAARDSDENAIQKAVMQWSIDNGGRLPASANGTPFPTAGPGFEISSTSLDICYALIPQYIAALPRDPTLGKAFNSCSGSYSTGYFAYRGTNDNRVTIQSLIGITATPTVPVPTPTLSAWSYALRFNGNGSGDIDRVKVSIDSPSTAVDVGTTDLTVEFWMKAQSSDNSSGPCAAGGDNWINGNVIIDRDVFGAGDNGDYGVSLYGGKIAFGVANTSTGNTICSSASVADDSWHHIAVTRKRSDGQLTIFVDGALSAQASGPSGDINYRDGRSTSYSNSDPYLVFGAEKHDYDPLNYPSYKGLLDEVRISNNLRYTGAFTRPSAPFTSDANTMGLYHFNEGSGTTATDSSSNAVNGTVKVGGSPNGPLYVYSSIP